MTYKTILASYQDTERSEQLIDYSTRLAADQDAHLIGLFVIPAAQSHAIYAPAPVQIASDLIEAQRQYYTKLAQEVEEKFVAAAKGAGLKYEWRCVEADTPILAETVVEHARSADLVVVGQVEPESKWESWAGIPEEVLMESGRPVLVVPYAGEHKATASNALVAWNGTRESARATFDALPLLRAAEKVKVLSVNIGKGNTHSFSPGDEIAITLARHDVKAETGSSINADISVGDELLSRAADLGSDLLVMGGYGHGRTYESLFGGATRHILTHMTMPVLMAH